LNWRHKAFQASALPTELPRRNGFPKEETLYTNGKQAVNICVMGILRLRKAGNYSPRYFTILTKTSWATEIFGKSDFRALTLNWTVSEEN